MTKVVCDICGKEMKRLILRGLEDFSFSISKQGVLMDICDDCKKGFFEWMQERKKENIDADSKHLKELTHEQ